MLYNTFEFAANLFEKIGISYLLGLKSFNLIR